MIVLEEERRRNLGNFAHDITAFLLFLRFLFALRLVFLERSVVLADYSLDLCDLSSVLVLRLN